jgi:methylamine--corrinoid protein Co-methyltransferase
VANQAITRNSTLPVVNVGYSAAGPVTRMLFHEHCAWVIASVVSGGSVEVGASARGTALDYTSPVEPLLASEVAHAAAGMRRTEANDIVEALLGEYESQLREPPAGQRYQECCDPATGKPGRELLELYMEVRREMTGRFGIQFTSASPYL